MKEKKQFRSSLLPYWLITGISKDEFKKRFHLEEDLTGYNALGQPVRRIGLSLLQRIGIPVKKGGEYADLTIEDDEASLFAGTIDGSLFNEILLTPPLSASF